MVPPPDDRAARVPVPGVAVLTRHRVPVSDTAEFLKQARVAVALLGARPGFVDAAVGRSIDDPELVTITTRWVDVGSYRRALSPYDVKVGAVPLLSTAIDEPTTFELLHVRDEAGLTDRPSARAADADEVGLGEAAAVFVPPLPG